MRTGFFIVLICAAGIGQPSPVLAGSFPAAAVGDIWFQADHAGFLGDGAQVVEEYYIRLPHPQVSFEAPAAGETGPWRGRAFVRLGFQDEAGERIGEASRNFDFTAVDEAAALSADRVQLFVLREPLDPRTASVRVEVEDLNARKRGLIYLITKKHRNGLAVADLEPPPFRAGAYGLSDLQFAWSIEPGRGASHFLKRGLDVVPNPARTYGLYRDTLEVYYEVYDPLAASPRPIEALFSVRDDQGQALIVGRDSLSTADASVRIGATAIPVRQLPPGTYDLDLQILDAAGGDTLRTTRVFNVVWSDVSWGRSEQDVLDEARVLLDEESYDRFRELQPGDRETFLASFWANHDPSAGSARNELREIFLQRVDYANKNFREFEKGIRTDRGRIFVRYGPADEITRQVLPGPGNTLTDVLDGEEGDFDDLVSDKTLKSRRDGVSSASFQNVDTRPYEIWKYTRMGDPLFPERERTTPNDGLTFIFVDDAGVGRYTLRHSSAFKRF